MVFDKTMNFRFFKRSMIWLVGSREAGWGVAGQFRTTAGQMHGRKGRGQKMNSSGPKNFLPTKIHSELLPVQYETFRRFEEESLERKLAEMCGKAKCRQQSKASEETRAVEMEKRELENSQEIKRQAECLCLLVYA